jgi:hypothetical protein
MQITSLPNCRIIDLGYGFTGSAHDASTWEQTRTFQDHLQLFSEEEFIWSDSAYPVSHLL